MAGSKTLTVIIVGDASSLKHAFSEAGGAADGVANKFQSVGSSLSTFGSRMTLGVTLPLAAAGVAAFNLASDAAEAANKVDVVFGDAAGQIHEFADSAAEDLGMASAEAESAAGTFGNLFTAMGIGVQPAADMSTQLLQLAADLASFNNVDPSQVLEALRSGLVGEAEPLRQFGINITAARIAEEALRLGLGQQGGVLDAAAKAQAAFSLIMQDSTTAQGDFARTADGAANQMRTAFAQVKDAGANLGTTLIPVFQDLIGIVQSAADWFSGLGPAMQGIVIKAAVVVAAIGPVSRVFGGITTAIGGVMANWPKLVAAFSNPYILGAAVVIGAIAAAFAIFTGKAADAARRVDDLAQAMADGTPKATAFGDAVVEWLDELDSEQTSALNRALAEMGTSYSELVGSVADGTLSLADFNAQIDAAAAAQTGLTPVTRGASTEISAEGAALRDLQSEVNATASALTEAEAAQREHSIALGEATSLGALMRQNMADQTAAVGALDAATVTATQGLTGSALAQAALAWETRNATAAVQEQNQTFQEMVDPTVNLAARMQDVADANAAVVLAEDEYGRNSPEYAQARLDVASAVAGLFDAQESLGQSRGSTELAARFSGDSAVIREEVKTTLGEIANLRAKLDGLATGNAIEVKILLNTQVLGPGASFINGRIGGP